MTTSNFKQPVVLLVSGIPSDCSLMSVGNSIENIEQKNVKITHISLIEEPLQSHGLHKAEIKVADQNHAKFLLNKAKIDVKHGDETYTLKIKIKRPQKPTNHSKEETDNSEEVELDEPVSTLRVVTWRELLQTNEDIFSGNEDRCILVTDLSPNITVKMLKRYFECTESSGGGTISNIIRIPDGILIIFDEQVATRVRQQTEHHIKSEKLKVFLKRIPSLISNSLLIEGEFKNETKLKEYLKQNNLNPHHCKHLRQYLFYVILNQTSEVSKIARDLETKMVYNKQLKVQRVCRGDCIKLKDFQKLGNHSIQRAIEEKHFEVTSVTRSADKDTAFVFFADYKDAYKLKKSIDSEPLTVDGVRLEIVLGPIVYEGDEQKYPSKNFEANCNDDRTNEEIISENSISNGAEDKKFTVKLNNFTLKLDVDVNVIDLVKETDQINELAEGFESIAKLTGLEKSSKSYSFCFEPMENQENRHYGQKHIQEKCLCELKAFFSIYTSKSHKFPEEIITVIKNKYKMKNIVRQRLGDKSVSVLVNWKDTTISGQVAVTGRVDDVDKFLEFLEQECKNHEQKLSNASSKLQKQNLLECRQSNKTPISWFELLQEDEKLFGKSKDRCVLIRNFPSDGFASDHLHTFLGYLQHELESNVEKALWIQDGYLIVLKNDQIARSLLQKKLYIGNTQLKISLKQIPSILRSHFIFEGVFNDARQIQANLKREVLSDVEFKVEKLPHQRQRFLVNLKSHSSEAQSIVERINKKKWTKEQFKTFLLCQTDCLKISNIERINNDRILQAFEEKDCEVTLIQRLSNNFALVYIADCEGIRKLAEPIIINGKAITIETYRPELEAPQSLPSEQYGEEKNFPSTSQGVKENNKSSQPFYSIKSFEYYIEAGIDALRLVCSSSRLKGNLDEELVGLARIEFIPSQSGLRGKFTPVVEQAEHFNGNQKQFEEKCREVTGKFFGELNPQIHMYTPHVAKRIQEIHGLSNHQTRVDEEDMCILLKWEPGNTGRVSLIGLAHQVKKFKDSFQYVVDNILLPPPELEIAETCGIISDAKKKHFVQIGPLGYSSGLMLNGIKRDVTETKTYIVTALKEICRTNITKCLSRPRCAFLKEVSTKTGIATKVNNLFLEKHIRAVLQFDESITLVHTRQAYQPSIDILEDMIMCELVPFSEDFDNLEKDSMLENLENSIKGISGLKLIVEGSCLTLVGLRSKFSDGYRYIIEYCQATAEKNELLKFDDPQKAYLCEFMSRLYPPEELNDIEYHENEKGIVLQGKIKDIECVSTWMKKKYETLKTDSEIIEEPWKIKYLLNDRGKQFLKTTAEQDACWIDVKKINSTAIKTTKTKKDLPEFQRNERKDFPSVNTHSKYPSALIPGTDVTIRVIKDDITRHKVDVIVNASNEELELRSAGVSGSILNQGGHHIQEEMNIERRKIGGRLHPGKAVTTGAGYLQFKKIIHVSGPVWWKKSKDESSKCLMESIKSCLIEAEKHNLKSISIPAISCGVFGGNVKVCTKLIVQSIVEHFTKNAQKKPSSLNTIDLIELFNEETIDEFSKQVESLVDRKLPESGSSSSLAVTQKQMWPTSRLQVLVEMGDILKNNDCDVIVNTAGPDFNLNGSQLSAKLLKKAGKSVKDEVVNKVKHNLISYHTSVCFTGNGNLSCKKIAHLIIPGQVDDLWRCLLEVLEEAEKMRMSSIAIPAIGTGNGGFNPHDAANSIKTAIESFEWNNPKYLKKIKLVIYEKKNFDLFQRVFFKELSFKVDFFPFALASSHSSSSKSGSSNPSIFPDRSLYNPKDQVLKTSIQGTSKHLDCNFIGEETSSLSSFSKYQQIELIFCSHKEENIAKVKTSIYSQFKNKCQEIKETGITGDVLTKSNINLRDLEDKHAVRIEKYDKPGNYGLVILGLSEDVTAARKEMRKLIEENQAYY